MKKFALLVIASDHNGILQTTFAPDLAGAIAFFNGQLPELPKLNIAGYAPSPLIVGTSYVVAQHDPKTDSYFRDTNNPGMTFAESIG